MTRLVYGVAVNDLAFSYEKHPNYKKCPFYTTWNSMLQRCYSVKAVHTHPTYKECEVCEEWLVFSNFKTWMEKQDWEGNQLDKDLLYKDNKVYSPSTCKFISRQLNLFITNCQPKNGRPVGCTWKKSHNKYQAICRNPLTGKKEYLGHFEHAEDAHLVWKKRKHELACQLAELQEDQEVKRALKRRFI